MSPKFVDKKLKIKQISQTALALFAKKGFAATSVEEIAEAAGIGKGTVYEYFNNKEGIFVAAIIEWIEESEIKITKILEGIENPVERLYAFVADSMEYFNVSDPTEPDANRLFIEILQQTFMEGGAFYDHHHLIEALGDKIRSIVIDILLDGVSKGVFSPKIARDSEKIAINLIAYLDGIGLHSLVAKEAFVYETQVRFYLQHLIQSILKEPVKGDYDELWNKYNEKPN